MSRSTRILCAALIFGVAIRIYLAATLDFTADEGAYLYDSLLLSDGRIPGGDVLTKSPLVAALYVLSVYWSDASLYASRIVAILFSLLSAWPLYIIGQKIYSRSIGLLAAVIWLVLAASIPYQVLGQTQAVANFFVLAALALWITCLVEKKQSHWWFLAGLVFALGVMSRKTAILSLVPIGLLGMYYRTWLSRRAVFGAVMGAAVMFSGWFYVAYAIYGLPGLLEASGAGYASIMWRNVSVADVPAWGVSIWEIIKYYLLVSPGLVVLALLTIVVLPANVLHLQKKEITWLAWLGVLSLAYAHWPALLPEYMLDFLPAITILLAITQNRLLTSPRWRAAAAAVLVISAVFGSWQASTSIPVGIYTASAIRQAARVLTENVPLADPILTAAVIVPYVSGHRVAGDVSHPLWYRYDFISHKQRASFLPEQNKVVNSASWLLSDTITRYVYFADEENKMSTGMDSWILIKAIGNEAVRRSNQLTIWRRG